MRNISNFAASNCLLGSPKDVPDGSCLPENSCVDSKYGNKQVPTMMGVNVCCKPKGTTGIGAPDPSCYGTGGGPKPRPGGGGGGSGPCRYNGYGAVFDSATGRQLDPTDYLGNNCPITCSNYVAQSPDDSKCHKIVFDSVAGECTMSKDLWRPDGSCPVHGKQAPPATQQGATTAAASKAAAAAAQKASAPTTLGPGGYPPTPVVPASTTPASGGPSGPSPPAKGINPVVIGLIILAILVAFYMWRKNRKGKTFFGKRK